MGELQSKLIGLAGAGTSGQRLFLPQVQVLVPTQTGERDRPGRRSERPVTNIPRRVRRDANRRVRDARAP